MNNYYEKELETKAVQIFESFDVNINDFGEEPHYFDGTNELYEIESEVDRYGGEGQGEEYWMISKLTIKETEEEIFVRFNGYYESWDGAEMTGWEIVEPREVVVTQWFSKY